MDYQSVAVDQSEIIKRLSNLNKEIELAETEYEKSELMAKSIEDKAYLSYKAKEGKVTDSYLKSMAREEAYNQYLDAITKKSALGRLKREYEINEKWFAKLLIDASKAKEDSKRFDSQRS